jgi:Predicted ATP-utilizing enzyme (ATP-grasp superfamily)
MNIFISEYLCSGAWTHPLDDAGLLNEAKGMLLATIEDFSKCPGVEVWTTWDHRLGPFPMTDIQVEITHSADEESAAFNKLVTTADASFVIAPEFHGLLKDRSSRIEASGRRRLSVPSFIVELFSDKLATYEHCRSHGIPTIPTYESFATGLSDSYFVHKPRFGAGSVETNRLTREEAKTAKMTSDFGPMLLQPYLEGESLSVGLIARGDQIDILPLTRQILSDSQSFKYIGSDLPVFLELQDRVEALVKQLLRLLPSMTGYLGIDLLYVPSVDELLLVEVNPRLTTSYLAYRQFTNENLLTRLLDTMPLQPIRWFDQTVQLRLT